MVIAEKIFEGYLVLDWRIGTMVIKHRKPKTSPQQVSVKLSLKVILPEVKEYTAHGEIEVTQSKVKEIVFDDI
jgi:hypothetical protein